MGAGYLNSKQTFDLSFYSLSNCLLKIANFNNSISIHLEVRDYRMIFVIRITLKIVRLFGLFALSYGYQVFWEKWK